MAGQVKITKALALRLLKEAVDKKGADYVDPAARAHDSDGCTYAKGSQPGCIVGHALYGVGVKPGALRELDRTDYTSFVSHKFLSDEELKSDGFVGTVLSTRFGVQVTEAAVRVLAAAQEQQDDGYTWGEALKAARQA